MLNEYCPRCGTLLVDGKCLECKAKVLVIHFDHDQKMIRNLSDAELADFVDFMKSEAKLTSFKTSRSRGENEAVFIPRQAVNWFEIREVTE